MWKNALQQLQASCVQRAQRYTRHSLVQLYLWKHHWPLVLNKTKILALSSCISCDFFLFWWEIVLFTSVLWTYVAEWALQRWQKRGGWALGVGTGSRWGWGNGSLTVRQMSDAACLRHKCTSESPNHNLNAGSRRWVKTIFTSKPQKAKKLWPSYVKNVSLLKIGGRRWGGDDTGRVWPWCLGNSWRKWLGDCNLLKAPQYLFRWKVPSLLSGYPVPA